MKSRRKISRRDIRVYRAAETDNRWIAISVRLTRPSTRMAGAKHNGSQAEWGERKRGYAVVAICKGKIPTILQDPSSFPLFLSLSLRNSSRWLTRGNGRSIDFRVAINGVSYRRAHKSPMRVRAPRRRASRERTASSRKCWTARENACMYLMRLARHELFKAPCTWCD